MSQLRERPHECDHTLHHVDAAGNLQGSWVTRSWKDKRKGITTTRRIVVCCVCGRWYGTIRDDHRK